MCDLGTISGFEKEFRQGSQSKREIILEGWNYWQCHDSPYEIAVELNIGSGFNVDQIYKEEKIQRAWRKE